MLLAQLPEPSRLGDVLMAFLSIAFEGAPYILIGTVLSGLISAYLDARLLDRVLPRNGLLSTLMAGVLGLVFPVCECAVVPVIRRLVQKGLPVSCAVTYMLAAPIMNPIVAVSTLTAFKEFEKLNSLGDWSQASMTLSRLSLGYVVAVIVGLIVLRFKPSQILQPRILATLPSPGNPGDAKPSPAAGHGTFGARLVQAMRAAMSDFVDTTMYFVIGVVITAVFNTQVDQSILNQVAGNPYLALPSIMGLAIVLSLCSTSDAFIAAPMAAFSMAAKLAFLVFGPMMDIKLLFMYSGLFKRRVVLGLLVLLFVLVACLSQPWYQLISGLAK